METKTKLEMNKLLITLAVIFVSTLGWAQTTTKNYVKKTNYQQPVQNEDEIGNLQEVDKFENITYFDGLGRPEQTISVRSGNQEQDIITPIVYDEFGRQTKDYLPYAKAVNEMFTPNDVLLPELNTYYINTHSDDLDSGAPNPYSDKSLEASPLSRVLEQGAPGKDWKIDTTTDTDHTIKFDYQSNINEEVPFYKVIFPTGDTEVPQLQYAGTYPANQLYKTVTKDENWQPGQPSLKDHTTEEFKNKQGQVILKRTYNNNAAHDTQYVYDTYGNLTYVLSPKGSDAILGVNNAIEQDILDELCYQYKYDYRNRLVEKKIPGKGWEYIIYDKLDRPVLTQDAIQREITNRKSNHWLFTKYDIFNRVVYTGKFTYHPNGGVDFSRSTLQALVNAQVDFNEVRSTSTTTIDDATLHYSNNVYPNIGIEVYTINYYDTHPTDISAQISNPEVFELAGTNHYISNNTKSLATGSKVKVLDTNDWIISATYYNDKAQPIYIGSVNEYLGTKDIVKTALDFVGKTIENESIHKKNGPTITINDHFTYDHAARLLTHTQTINNGSPELIVNNSYDALGQLIQKKVGGDVNTVPETSIGLQTVDYTYNIRGWLRQINDIDATGTDLFSFKINYNTTQTQPSEALYNGNISETHWHTVNDSPTTKRGYAYSYDALNRLEDAKGIQIVFGTLHASHNYYSESGMQYDKNGNLLRLNRKEDGSASYIDRLFYTYDSGNKLVAVQDGWSGASAIKGFIDGNTTGNDYTYDANGNMLRDLNKGIGTTTADGIRYNHLNLPTQVRFNNDTTKNISYIYDATGTKQAKVVTNGGSLTTTKYAGNFIYEETGSGEVLKFFNHPEGYVEPITTNSILIKTEAQGKRSAAPNSTLYKYVYQYKDHLGNIRLSYTDTDDNNTINTSTEIIEESNYYPFGLKHKGYNNVVNGTHHPYGFGGKEEQSEFGINWVDITARNYDPTLGRWMNLDPLAEYMRRHSPYNYAFDNPIFYIDPDGMAPMANEWPPKWAKKIYRAIKKEFSRDRSSEFTTMKNDLQPIRDFFAPGDTPSPDREITDKGGVMLVDDSGEASGPQDQVAIGNPDEVWNVEGLLQAGGTSKKLGKSNGTKVTKGVGKRNGKYKLKDGDKNVFNHLSEGNKDAEKLVKQVKSIVEMGDLVSSDSINKVIVNRYITDSDGNSSVVSDTLTDAGFYLHGKTTNIAPDTQIDSVTTKDIKVKKEN